MGSSYDGVRKYEDQDWVDDWMSRINTTIREIALHGPDPQEYPKLKEVASRLTEVSAMLTRWNEP